MLKSFAKPLIMSVAIFLMTTTLVASNQANPFIPADLITIPGDYTVRVVSRDLFRGELEELVNRASGGKARLVNFFQGPEGMTGVILTGMGEAAKEIIGWVPPGGRVLLFGKLINCDGQEQTEIATNFYLTPDKSVRIGELEKESKWRSKASAKQRIAALQELEGVIQFDGLQEEMMLYCMISFDCPYCIRMSRTIVDMEDDFRNRRIQVKWIPVTNSDSNIVQRQSANILDNGLDGMSKPLSEARPESVAKVRRNTEIVLETFPVPKTPMLAWWGNDGIQTKLGNQDVIALQNLLATLDKQIAEKKTKIDNSK